MGDLPSPSEYIRFVNSTVSSCDVEIDYVEVTAPVYEQWPPASHRQVFIKSDQPDNESDYAADILRNFMTRAWRRDISDAELQQKRIETLIAAGVPRSPTYKQPPKLVFPDNQRATTIEHVVAGDAPRTRK